MGEGSVELGSSQKEENVISELGAATKRGFHVALTSILILFVFRFFWSHCSAFSGKTLFEYFRYNTLGTKALWNAAENSNICLECLHLQIVKILEKGCKAIKFYWALKKFRDPVCIDPYWFH